MSLGLTRPPLADSTMLTLTSHYTATNAKHHRYAAPNLPRRPPEEADRARRGSGRAGAGGRLAWAASGALDRPRHRQSVDRPRRKRSSCSPEARGTRTQKTGRKVPGPRVPQATSGPRATWGTKILPLPTSIPGTEHGWETSHLVRMTPSRTTARVRALSPATRRERTDASQTPPVAHPAGRQERWQRP